MSKSRQLPRWQRFLQRLPPVCRDGLERLSALRQQTLVVASVFFMLGLFSISAALFGLHRSEAAVLADAIDVEAIRFALYDAEVMCSERLEAQVGAALLRYHVDSHSSRFDSKKSVFRVYMSADIGSVEHFEEVSVHCFVDQWDRDLSHFRQYGARQRVAVSAELKFFQ